MLNKEDVSYTQIDPNIFKCEDTITYDVSCSCNDITSEDNGTCHYTFTVKANKYVNDKKHVKPQQPWYINQINKNHNRKKK